MRTDALTLAGADCVHFTGAVERVNSESVKGWIWKSVIAGFCGSMMHSLFMYLKSWTGLLPSFQPYQHFQITLNQWIGTDVPAIVPWAFSFLNGMTILGFLFARIYRLLPGRTGAMKGMTFGLIGWVFMNLIFFPLIGLGPLAIRANAGFGPVLLSLVMLQTYSVVLGTVYAVLGRRSVKFFRISSQDDKRANY